MTINEIARELLESENNNGFGVQAKAISDACFKHGVEFQALLNELIKEGNIEEEEVVIFNADYEGGYMTITKLHDGSLELSDIVKGYRVHKKYFGYTRQEAIDLFLTYIKEGSK